jgi:hypothetical protein
MAHAQKPDFVFRRNGRVHLNRRGASVQSTTGSRGVRISGSNAGYTMFRGSVKSTCYPLHSPVPPSLPLPASPRAITFQLDSNNCAFKVFRLSCYAKDRMHCVVDKGPLNNFHLIYYVCSSHGTCHLTINWGTGIS